MSLLSPGEFPGSGENPLHRVFPEEEKCFLAFWNAAERSVTSEREKEEPLKSWVQKDIYFVLREKTLINKCGKWFESSLLKSTVA